MQEALQREAEAIEADTYTRDGSTRLHRQPVWHGAAEGQDGRCLDPRQRRRDGLVSAVRVNDGVRLT